MRIEFVRSAIADHRPPNQALIRENARQWRFSQPCWRNRHRSAELRALVFGARRGFSDHHLNFFGPYRRLPLAFVHVRGNTAAQMVVRIGNTDSGYLSPVPSHDYSRSVIGLTSQVKPYDFEVK